MRRSKKIYSAIITMSISYIRNRSYDSFFFFSPLLFVGIFTTVIHLFFPEYLDIKNDPLWLFFFVIVFDVAHVYGSLYRSYFNLTEFREHKKLYIITPIITWIVGTLFVLYDRSGEALIYFVGFLAVYHFIKQQLGFVMIYASKEEWRKAIDRIMDKSMSWLITGVPILYWWSHLDSRNYIWFMRGEFIKLPEVIFPIVWMILILYALVYIAFECLRVFQGRGVNILKYAYILMTFFVWFNGIVWHNSLLIFAFGNILLHGLNYLGIVYLSTKNKLAKDEYETVIGIKWLIGSGFVSFYLILFFFALIEEYLWDQLFRFEQSTLWGTTFYSITSSLPDFFYALIIWILITPQLTHYFLDGYVWRSVFKSGI